MRIVFFKGWTPEQRLAFLHKIIISVVGSILAIVIGVSIFISCRRSLNESKRKRKEYEHLKLMNNKLNIDNDHYIICSNLSSVDSQINNKHTLVKSNDNLNKQQTPTNYYCNQENNDSKSKLLNGNISNSNNLHKIDINPDNFSLNLSEIDIEDEQEKAGKKRYLTNEGLVSARAIKH